MSKLEQVRLHGSIQIDATIEQSAKEKLVDGDIFGLLKKHEVEEVSSLSFRKLTPYGASFDGMFNVSVIEEMLHFLNEKDTDGIEDFHVGVYKGTGTGEDKLFYIAMNPYRMHNSWWKATIITEDDLNHFTDPKEIKSLLSDQPITWRFAFLLKEDEYKALQESRVPTMLDTSSVTLENINAPFTFEKEDRKPFIPQDIEADLNNTELVDLLKEVKFGRLLGFSKEGHQLNFGCEGQKRHLWKFITPPYAELEALLEA